jgi:hypothetical protein
MVLSFFKCLYVATESDRTAVESLCLDAKTGTLAAPQQVTNIQWEA